MNYREGETISAYGYLYDGRGNIIKEEARLYLEEETVEQEYTYEYDGMSQLIRAVLSQTTTTAEGKKEKEKATTAYVYDPAGNRIKMSTDKNGSLSTVTYTYDEAGRLVRSEDSEHGETVYTYDGAGNLVREENADPEGGRYYQYDAADRLTAVMDKDNLLLAALYDGNGNRVFTMEYAPELLKNEVKKLPAGQDREEDPAPSETDDGESEDDGYTENETPEGGITGNETVGTGETAEGNTGRRNTGSGEGASGGRYTGGGAGKEDGNEGTGTRETAALPESGSYKEKEDENGEEPEGTKGTASGSGASDKGGSGWKSFWYGVLCQAADIFLPAPTPFKAWLHDKMGFTDSVSVLFEKEVYEAELSAGSCSIQEERSPFALINNAVKASTGKELSSEAYRQVSYVNDISFSNEQVLMERAVNGSLGESVTGYSYGLWRESYSVEADAGTGISIGMGTGSGTYYYTGTGSVANLVSGSGTKGYSYGPGGAVTVYGQGSMESRTNTQAGAYGYNGEYTHGSLGLQYLRARYLKVETGTFTSRDTYVGRVRDILSQNRYTYAENNPVTFADPSGHKTIGAIIGNAFSNVAGAGKNTNTGKKPGSSMGANVGNVAQSGAKSAGAIANTVKNTISNTVGNSNNSRGGGSSGGTSSLLDNIKIYNGIDYYNNIVIWTPIPTLMSSSGGSLTYAESVAAKEEAARCMGYEYVAVGYQEKIEWDEILVINKDDWFYIPKEYSEIVLNKETGVITEEFHYPGRDWGIVGAGSYIDESARQWGGVYQVAVGPGILNPKYPNTGRLLDTDYPDVTSITLILENKEKEMWEIMECVVIDEKAHTYNQYPDGHENSSLPYVAVAGIENGRAQTAISYPFSVNAKKPDAFAPGHMDGSIIEFVGQSIDFNIKDYYLKEIIVNYK